MKGRTPQQAVEDWILTGSHNQLPDVNETLILYKSWQTTWDGIKFPLLFQYTLHLPRWKLLPHYLFLSISPISRSGSCGRSWEL